MCCRTVVSGPVHNSIDQLIIMITMIIEMMMTIMLMTIMFMRDIMAITMLAYQKSATGSSQLVASAVS